MNTDSASDHDARPTRDESRAFYDAYIDRQATVGINDRHRSIVKHLGKAGLRSDHRVLEVGCGIGAVTELVLAELGPAGSIVAVDLSPRSIDLARHRLGDDRRLELLTLDVVESPPDGQFDVVLLPDVIEHIPAEHHPGLFMNLAGRLDPGGFVLLHYPNPNHLEWCHANKPETLQVIDLPIHADLLIPNAYAAGLYLHSYETYPIWVREGDYVVAVLRPTAGLGTFTAVPEEPPSLIARALCKLHHLRTRQHLGS